MKPHFWSALFLALAALPMAAHGRGHGPRAERMAQALNLSDAQQTSIQTIRDRHHQDLVLRRDAVKQAQRALQTAARDVATPEAQLRTLFDKASAARFEMMLARRSVHQEIQALLTPEQRVQAAELRGRMHERRRHRQGARGRNEITLAIAGGQPFGCGRRASHGGVGGPQHGTTMPAGTLLAMLARRSTQSPGLFRYGPLGMVG